MVVEWPNHSDNNSISTFFGYQTLAHGRWLKSIVSMETFYVPKAVHFLLLKVKHQVQANWELHETHSRRI